MNVLSQLACALGRRDEVPNVALAQMVALHRDRAAVEELAEAMLVGPHAVQNDSVKTLYEIGALDPSLLAPHVPKFLTALASPNNRLVWGALTALDCLAEREAAKLVRHLPQLRHAAASSSVIAKDKLVSILGKFCAAGFAKRAAPALLALVADAAVNQLPSYAETAAATLPAAYLKPLHTALARRLPGVAQPSKRRRLERVLQRLAA